MAVILATLENLVTIYEVKGRLTQEGKFSVDTIDGRWVMPDGDVRRQTLKHYTLEPPMVDL